MKIKKADLILVRGDGFISNTIKDITNCEYSHVAGLVKDNEIVEAQGFSTTGYEGLDEYKCKADVFTCEVLTDEQRDEIVKYVEKQVGTHYNWFLIFVELIRYLFNYIISHKKKNNSNICSTLWSDAYKSVGIDLCPNILYPSPRDLSESKLLKKIGSL